jgi:hypothetical protein
VKSLAVNESKERIVLIPVTLTEFARRANSVNVTGTYCRGAEGDSLKVPFCRAMSPSVG